MKKQIYLIFIFLFFASNLKAVEYAESVVFPETVPDKGKLQIPIADKPVLKKQQFLPDFNITPTWLWQTPKFYLVSENECPVSVNVYGGNFSSYGGSIKIVSPDFGKINLESDNSYGKFKNLSQNKTNFSYQLETLIDPSIKFFGQFGTTDYLFGRQRYNNYNFNAGLNYYLRQNLNISTNFGWENTNIKQIDSNAWIGGNLSLYWQPLFGHNIEFSFVPEKDTAFEKYEDGLSSFLIKYYYSPIPEVVLGYGEKYQDNKFYLTSELILNILYGMQFKVDYNTGINKIRWSNLYDGNMIVKTLPSIVLPEETFSLNEKISYYWDKENTVELNLYQENWKNYVYWDEFDNSDYIVPNNLPNHYLSGLNVSYKYRNGFISHEIFFKYRSDSNITYVPKYRTGLSLNYFIKTWTLNAGYEYSSSRYFTLSHTKSGDEYGDVSLGVKKKIRNNVDAYLNTGNLLEQKIEIQPNLFYNSLNFKVGIIINF